jgi:hypothetical protein
MNSGGPSLRSIGDVGARGFAPIEELHVTLPRIWVGSPQDLWQYFQEISTLFHSLNIHELIASKDCGATISPEGGPHDPVEQAGKE